MTLDELWKSALGEIEIQISKPNFITWFKNSNLLEKKDGVALVAFPNNFAKEWAENKYQKIILRSLRNLDDATKRVEFVVAADSKNAGWKPRAVQNAPKEQQSFSEFRIDPETNLNPRYTIGSFIVGSSNELAYAAGTAVIEEIGRKYNPLFIYGGVGVGKTHLIQAVGNEIKNRYQNKIKVKYTPSESFINEVVQGIRTKRMETVKERYRNVDVLIIDDIQFISGKTTTETEFFHTFNALYENNKQIILSSDRPPRYIPTLEERLRSRFEGGMIADIAPPDYELRVAVLKNKLAEKKIQLSDELINYIAAKVQKNLRELEGILNRVLFYQQTKNKELTLKIVEQLLNETIQEPVSNVNPAQIIKCVADTFDVNTNDLTGRSRKKELVAARQITMYLMRELLKASYPYIGEKLGKRDHTTAIYACEKVEQELSKNPALNQKILLIKDLISKN
jgi:chromosomal replication initiator protein